MVVTLRGNRPGALALAIALACGAAGAVEGPAPRDLLAGGEWRLLRPSAEAATMERVPAQDDPGREAAVLRVSVKVPAVNRWEIQLSRHVEADLREGQSLRLRFRGRSPSGSVVTAVFEQAGDRYLKSLVMPVRLTPEWKEYAFGFPVSHTSARGYGANFQAGPAAGTFELADIHLDDYGMDPRSLPPDFHFDLYGGLPHDDRWRAAADERIRRHRMGNVVVRVTDASGRPAAGATVAIRQRGHAFRFGTAIAPGPLLATTPDGENYRKNLLRLFNYVTLENQLKWASQDDQTPDLPDRMLAWCAEHDLPVRGHVLFWPNYEHLPLRLRGLRGPALRDAIRDHVTDYVARYRGRVALWDVVNEAVDNHQIADELGKEVLGDAFRWAHAADPAVPLVYNDNDLLDARDGPNAGRRRAMMALVRDLLTVQKAPVSMLGVQGHMAIPLTPAPELLAVLDEWSQWGLPLEVTEFDVGLKDDAAHASYLEETLTAIFSHPSVRAFVMWGFWEGSHWRAGDGGAIFRRDWSERPSVAALDRLIHRDWWTDARGAADVQGIYRARAFLGRHEISATHGGRTRTATVEVTRGGDAETGVSLRLSE